MLVDEPGAVTPIFRPFRRRRLVAAALLGMPSTMPAYFPDDQRLDRVALGLLRDRVLVGARHEIDAAADQRLQCARTARKAEDLDVEPFGLEVALPLRDRERQVVEERLAADADRELGFFRRLGGGKRCGQRQRERATKDGRTSGSWAPPRAAAARFCRGHGHPRQRPSNWRLVGAPVAPARRRRQRLD